MTVSVRTEQLRWLRATLIHIQVSAQAGDYAKDDSGVCNKVAQLRTEGMGGITPILRSLARQWPDGSGDSHYPIHASYKTSEIRHPEMLEEYIEDTGDTVVGQAMYQYEMLADKWVGEQLLNRLAFLDWCILDLERQIAEEMSV